MYKFNLLDKVAFMLLIIGGIDWGILGLSNFNLLGFIFGCGAIARIVYILVGASAVTMLIFVIRSSRVCKPKGKRL